MITVLTPTYNRAYTLPRLFKSLCDQKCKNFEWVVVDNESTDNTRSLLDEFKKSAPFPVRIIQQPKLGKHVAVNSGVLAAEGDWIFIVDSDDALTPNAISTIEEKLSEFNSDRSCVVCNLEAMQAVCCKHLFILQERMARSVYLWASYYMDKSDKQDETRDPCCSVLSLYSAGEV